MNDDLSRIALFCASKSPLRQGPSPPLLMPSPWRVSECVTRHCKHDEVDYAYD
jgi:hypothetical protein